MSSILRSSKFVRYFVGLARNIVLSTPREVDGSLVQRSQCLAGVASNNYATSAIQSQTSSLDRSIKRLDEDARRVGRISRKEIEEVLSEIRQSKKATSSQSLMVIRCCGNLVPEEVPELRTKLVKQVWNTLEKLGVPMDISHYNALLRVYLENEHRFSPSQFLTELEAKGVEPNRVTYQRLIAGFCQEGDIVGATRILEHMREKQLPVSENVFNALILGHSQADDLESAHGILGVMKQAGLEPSSETYTTLICGYAKKGDGEAIEKLFEESEAKDVFLADKDILEIVYTLGVNKHTDLIDKVLSKVKYLIGYNQDAANVILRLINKGDVDTALKVFKTMKVPSRLNGQPVYLGNFMIKQMVKANVPVEKIVAVCKQFRDEGLNTLSFASAVQSTFTVNNVNQTLALLRALADNKEDVRIHYFWPVLIAAGKEGNKSGVKTILTAMINEFNLPPNGETLRECVMPFFKNQSPNAILEDLVDTGLKRGTSAAAIIGNLVGSGKLVEAANFALQNIGINFLQAYTIRSLVLAFRSPRDLDPFVTLVRALADSVDRNRAMTQNEEEEGNEEAGDLGLEKEEIVGKCVLELVKRNNPNIVTVLKAFLDQGMSISSSSAQRIESSLNEQELTEEVSALLAKLASGEFVAEPLKQQGSRSPRIQISRNATALASLKEKLIERNESVEGVLRQMFTLQCWNKDVDATLKTKAELEANNFEITSAQHALLLDMFVNLERLSDALQMYADVKAKEPGFTLDRLKSIKLANLLTQNDKLDEAIEILKSNANMEGKETNYVVNSLCWRMLNSCAEKKDVEKLKKLLDTLTENNYVDVTNVLLGPLIKVHLLNNDIEGALDEFERCCETHRATPWKNELMCKLIQAEDATNLQRLTDLSTQVHGEVNSLYDLVLAFVECGRVRQARKILETPGLRAREDRINLACQRYKNDGLVAPLENLLEVTKDLGHIDRSSIYYQLLLSYEKANDVDKAQGLWTTMQEEDVPVSEEFLVTLGNFLKANGREVPFAIPSLSIKGSKSQTENTAQNKKKPVEIKNRSPQKDAFLVALQENKLDNALEAKIQMEASGEELNRTDRTRLLEALVKENRINEANKLMLSWLPDKPPALPILKFYATRLSLTGDIEAFDQFGAVLSDSFQKLVSFDNKRVNCLLASGKGLEELARLEKAIDSATTPEEIDQVCAKFPRGGVLGILEQHPDCIPQYEIMMQKYVDKGFVAPANCLFIYCFCNSQIDKAKAIYDVYLNNTSRLMFQGILMKAKSTKDAELVKQLKNVIENSPSMTPGVIGHIYSTLVTIYCYDNKIDEAISQLEEGLKVCSIENFSRSALIKLKASLEANNKTFKYTIPSRNSQKSKDESSSSSSSSDDEKKPAQIKQ